MSTIITNYYEIPNSEVSSANDYIVDAGGEMYVLEGGTLTNSVAQNGGVIWLDTGATGQNVSATLDGEAWVYCPVVVMAADSDGYIYVDAGGIVSSGAIQTDGRCVVYAGADVSDFNVSGGSMLLYGGSADNTVVGESGYLNVQQASGVAENTTVLTGGLMRVTNYGTAQNTTVEGGKLEINDSLANGVTMNSGTLNAEYSSVENIQINGGSANFSASFIYDIELGNGVAATMDGESILSGKVVLADGASFTVNGGAVEFDTTFSTSTDAQLLGYSALTGDAVYSLSAGGATEGMYLLASDAATFGSDILFANTALSFDSSVYVNDLLFTLGLTNNNDLALTVSAVDLSFFNGSFNGVNVMFARDVDGVLGIYDLNGDIWSSWTLSENICATGDFNGDGLDDLLTMNSEGYVIGEMSNGSGVFLPEVLNFKASGWDILGTGDFDGNGTDDVLVANPNAAADGVGLFGYWGGGTDWQLLGGYTSDWEIVSVGDFDGDGKSDTLWRNSFTGGDSRTYNAYCTFITDADDAWRVVSVADQNDWNFLCSGDFDGDGVDDIAMINAESYVGIWCVNEGTMESWSIMSWDNLVNWTCVSSGDFSGDGTDDMLWYNPTNNNYCCWQIENMEIASKQYFTTVA